MRKPLSFFFLLFAQLLIAQVEFDKKWGIYALAESGAHDQLQKRPANEAFLVRFDQPFKRSDLHKKNIELLRLLDDYHAIIATTVSAIDTVRKMKMVRANDQWKLAEKLLTNTVKEKSSFAVHSSHPSQTLQFLQSLHDVEIIRSAQNTIYFTGELSKFKNQLLARAEVRYLGLEATVPVQEGVVLDLNPSINTVNPIYTAYPELNGTGIAISVKDNKFRESDIDLLGKLIGSPLLPNIEDNHATDMATIIAGLGNSSIKSKGIAPAAQLQSSDFLNLSPDGASNLSDLQVFIQNHSYGTISENFYGTLAEAYDAQIADNTEELHIFSSGNAGEQTPTDGPYANIATYGNLTGNFKMAKNTLVVGAMDEEKKVQEFSSRGPTYDGRIKPELIGYSIVGTSNATALTSGIATLLLQAYQETYRTNASAALLKALLINTADDVSSQGPDYRSGYGSINALKAVQSLKNGQFLTDTIAQGQTKTFEIPLPPNVKTFQATLVWTDPPAEINSNKALVNDLDLRVIDPGGSEHLPWVLDTTPNSTALEAPAQKGMDRLNNVEQVLVENPPEGILVLQVDDFDLRSNTQEFSIAYNWQLTDSFRWSYPLANDNFPYDGETASYFRWDSSFDQNEGSLSISYDLGDTWQIISENVALKDGFYLWPAPEDVTGTGILKMDIAGTAFLSDPFVISQTTATKTSLDCEDTIELNWNPQPGVSAYTVYNLEDTSMQPIAMVSDTTYITDKSVITSPYFAVTPLLDTGREGVRAQTIDYRAFEAGCYQTVVIATPSEDGVGGLLSISLSSLHDVVSVNIERKTEGVFTTIDELTGVTTLTPIFLDTEPEQGLNQYRVRVMLRDGRSYVSEETDLIFLTSTPFITLPNPIENGITVYTGDFSNQEVQLGLYGIDGKLILQRTITESQQFVPLETLRPGVYILRLFASGGANLSKLVYKR
ncbi:hypothetical protein MTsPCn5_13260 [Croceitalea sp. MTPC5]|uniref:S8 family peptidase n=1 Tax=Croceitalea sp. MTPC5 TaxID=3056565 RepID=UPI002B3FAE03|nr:hypothetical protein MTsPCn5_13260 [Croceitalea sp. MTPC5]